MKKALAIVLALVTVFTLVACGGSPSGDAKAILDLEKAKTAISGLDFYPQSIVEPNDEELKTIYGLDPALLKSRLVGFPMMNVHASAYFILLPNEGKDADVKAAMDAYMTQYQTSWDQYLPDQAEMVKNRMVTEIETSEGTYIVYLISENNDELLKAIKTGLSA